MEKFVCVRLVKANDLDLALFQFDFDLTFAAFFFNGDKTLYGRYGTRSSHAEAEADISLAGFAKAMEGALALHRNYPANKESLAGKQAPRGAFATPLEMPQLKGKYKADLNYQGAVSQSCLHCHQVLDTEREMVWESRKPMPETLLFPYPLPERLGLALDPATRAAIARVTPDSAAARAGLRAGDELLSLDNQPLLSIADAQWALHNLGSSTRLTAKARRDGAIQNFTLELSPGWRRGDISWRTTTWNLRRLALGGMVLAEATPEQRAAAGAADDELALLVKHVGQYGPHAVARDAGARQGDVLVAVNGEKTRRTETEVLAFLLENTKKDQPVAVTFARGGKRMEVRFTPR